MRAHECDGADAVGSERDEGLNLVEAHLAARAVQQRVLTVCSCVGLLGVGILSVCLAVRA